MELVLDASAFVKLLVDEPGSERAADVYSSAEEVVAPDWILVEAAMALWKHVQRNLLSAEDAMESLAVAERFGLELAPAADLLPQALAIACELPHPLYDCLYLLLALHGGRTLVTADGRMREAAERLGVRVAWVGD